MLAADIEDFLRLVAIARAQKARDPLRLLEDMLLDLLAGAS